MKKESMMLNFCISAVYTIIFVILFLFCIDKLNITQAQSFQVWLTAGIIYLILGKYVLEKHFTTPLNVFSNTLTIIIALLFDPTKNVIWWIIFSYIFFICAITIVVISTSKHKFKGQNLLYKMSISLGNSKIIFSLIYLVYLYKYIGTENLFLEFLIAIILWIDLVYTHSIEKLFYLLYSLKKQKEYPLSDFCGIVESKFGNSLYTFIPKENIKHSYFCFGIKQKNGKVAIAHTLSELNDIDGKKLLLYLSKIELNPKELGIPNYKNSLLDNINEIYGIGLDSLNPNLKSKLIEDAVFCQNAIGYVIENSDINSISFLLFSKYQDELYEGMIVSTHINKRRVLYQIINAKTKKDEYGNLYVFAQKIGDFDELKNKIVNIRWLPKLNDLIFKLNNSSELVCDFEKSVGTLPETNFQIQLSNINQLVTYNTAILGILGIGKSCLAFELITKVIKENIKVICIDISNQYASYDGLFKYINICDFELDNEVSIVAVNNACSTTGNDRRPSEWGNMKIFTDSCKAEISSFLKQNDKKIKVINPNRYIVTKAATTFNITEHAELSLVEKTRCISEIIFEELKTVELSDQAKCMLVFEEAHSLIPEFNSVSIKGDETHSNAIAKVILQGRKYGLGSLLITQRTANISKSALNQCNTIFALRSYDDTSKNFLDNYIGSSYSSLISSLEERTAIVTGKGIDCKNPIVIKLNDKSVFEKYNKTNNPLPTDSNPTN